MKLSIVFTLIFLTVIAGCGYTQQVTLPNNIQTIAVPTFENAIPPDELFTYRPGLEIELTNAVIDRLIFDGNLRVENEDKADAILKGKVVSYRQEGLSFDDFESVDEFRLFLIIDFELIDQRTGETLIMERNFSGRSEYFTSRTNNANRLGAGSDVVVDLARNVVDRIVEDW